MKKSYKEEILKLRSEGKSYKDIRALTGASLSTVSYYLGEGQKSKNRDRRIKRRTLLTPLQNKLEHFKYSSTRSSFEPPVNKDIRSKKGWIHKNLTFKISKFSCQDSLRKTLMNKLPYSEHSFTAEDLIKKSNSKCYLTGRTLNLEDGKSYELDHIVPKFLNGQNDLENCGVACKDANRAKAHMSIEEFFKLCVDVVNHNNLKLT